MSFFRGIPEKHNFVPDMEVLAALGVNPLAFVDLTWS